MSTSAMRMARKREAARASGFCLTCCKEKPTPGQAICETCNAARHERLRRSRQSDKEKIEFQHVIQTHEHAADVASEYHLYDDAVHRYKYALDVPGITAEQHVRISNKLIHVFYLGNPSGAVTWFYQTSSQYLKNAGTSPQAAEFLLRGLSILWTDMKIEESQALISEAKRIAEALGDARLRKMTELRIISNLHLFGRYEEAAKLLRSFEGIHRSDNIGLQSQFYFVSGVVAASMGQFADARESFEQAIHLAENLPDPSRTESARISYGLWIAPLGYTQLAKDCLERALFVARQKQLSVLTLYACLKYAKLLDFIGQHELAREYWLNALSYNVQVPVIEHTLAEVGIPIALRTKDDAILNRCLRTDVLEGVFQSKITVNIGFIATVYAQLYAAQGKRAKVQALLHRAIRTVSHIDICWELTLEVARHGLQEDIPVARELLVRRLSLPCAEVPRAFLSLFEALVLLRGKKRSEAYVYAKDAIAKFNAFGWQKYVTETRTLFPDIADVQPPQLSAKQPYWDIQPALTSREQQVTELVLRGLTNRAIAAELSITENTVEKHMTAIMNRLGVRSRYQLIDRAGGNTT